MLFAVATALLVVGSACSTDSQLVTPGADPGRTDAIRRPCRAAQEAARLAQSARQIGGKLGPGVRAYERAMQVARAAGAADLVADLEEAASSLETLDGVRELEDLQLRWAGYQHGVSGAALTCMRAGFRSRLGFPL